MQRRTWLKRVVHAVGAFTGAVVVFPAFVTALSPVLRRPESSRWRVLGGVANFPLDQVTPTTVKVGDQSAADPLDSGLGDQLVYVWRQAERQFVVFSRSCTDLGCPLNFDPGSEMFLCPCHGGIFAKDGTVKAGPPSRPMDRYANRLRDGFLEIDLHSVPPMS
ncbi:MAG: hypothetical protein A2428_10235 [Bdellovibrionales bacterium RIFOXYC1_FULL_54_43]|nr:MAG: hypothetical protein A2428_10235 [Bdellovibrionales bacterium RIFOXYC1_FULL_54_43]OFZ80503.1 MAG: hypothetical protein A2603_13020 [Bdellovibrionales bacterium RIFOXYD1_FULL_55_31]